MSEKIIDIAAGIFIMSVALLTLISILSIWDVLPSDATFKSFTTIAIIGFSALVVCVAAKFMEKGHASAASSSPAASNVNNQVQ